MRRNTFLERKSGFEQILQGVKEFCLSPAGERLVDGIRFMCSLAEVDRELTLTDEFLSILLSNKAFPMEDYFDMGEELKRLRIKGSFISVEAMFRLWKSLKTIEDCLDFFTEESSATAYPLLRSLCEGIDVEKQITARCKALLSSEGEILDNASDALFVIRTKKRSMENEVGKRLRKLLNLSKQEGWAAADSELCIKEGKGVIPVIASNKRRINGFVIDESSSGQTLYIEPSEVVELNNEIKKLEFEERREIITILQDFTDFLQPFIPSLLSAYGFLARVDFIRAKAKYAYKIRAGKPVMNDYPVISWFEARHPLLEENLKRNGKDIIPLRVELNRGKRILIISGPNAGGKSVCLKTVGLLQYMLQCGLLVPMKQTSECGLFEDIFIDIGDEQSIENDLSTYSSHLLAMKRLCEKAGVRSLFLIDEFGSGTDPNAGGAIAEAVLEYLNSKGAFGIVTTHYSNLKLLADKYESMNNAAMLFDTKALKPLYRLSIGNPGSSFAFEIADTIGLPQQIIESARKKVGNDFVDFEQSLQTLAVEKMQLKAKEKELQLADELLDSLVEQYKSKNLELQGREKEIIYEAKKQAKEILKDANRQIEETIREIRSVKAEKQETNKIRTKIKETTEKARSEIEHLETEIRNTASQEKETKTHIPFDDSGISKGDIVLINGHDSYAEVQKVRKGKDKIDVLSGNISLSLPLSQVRKVRKDIYLKQQKQNKTVTPPSRYSIMNDINRLRAEFVHQIDLRGCRADEALKRLAKQIDNARLLGESEISVLHGKGDGILKTVLRDYLKECPEVESFKAARLDAGGEGITQIKLK